MRAVDKRRSRKQSNRKLGIVQQRPDGLHRTCDVALTELDATPTGTFIPKAIARNVAPGKKASANLATDKDCVFDLHGIYADGSKTESTGVDLCKDKSVNLVN